MECFIHNIGKYYAFPSPNVFYQSTYAKDTHSTTLSWCQIYKYMKFQWEACLDISIFQIISHWFCLIMQKTFLHSPQLPSLPQNLIFFTNLPEIVQIFYTPYVENLEDKKWGVELCWHPKNNWFHAWVLKLKVAYGLGRFSLKKTLVASETHKCVQSWCHGKVSTPNFWFCGHFPHNVRKCTTSKICNET